MSIRPIRSLGRVVVLLSMAWGCVAWAAEPIALACGGDIIPVLRAVEELQRERTQVAQRGDALALQVVDARLAVADALRRYSFRRYMQSDPADAIAAMRDAVYAAESVPRGQGSDIASTARAYLGVMVAAAGSTGDARPHGDRQ